MPPRKVLLLGLGMQGRAALRDLVRDPDMAHIDVADSNPELGDLIAAYPPAKVTAHPLDASDEANVMHLMRQADIVVEALPGGFGVRMGELAAEAGASLVSSMYYREPTSNGNGRTEAVEERLGRLDDKARERGITILTEFGLDPGIDLVMGARALSELDEVREFHSYGAGIPDPRVADNPLRYKFSWSAVGVMRAYRRPARIITEGRVRKIEGSEIFAPRNVHTLEMPELETALECYPNGDSEHYARQFGIRDDVVAMGRYGCRLPGHCYFWWRLANSGFLQEEPIRVNGSSVSPLQLTASLLQSQRQFQYEDDEEDITLLRIDASGLKDGHPKRVVYQMIDRRDLNTGFTSMQRTVGYTMSLGARSIASGKLAQVGLITPLDVGYDLVAEGLAPHGIVITRQELDPR